MKEWVLLGLLIVLRCWLDYIDYKEEQEDMKEDDDYDRKHNE